MPTLAMAMQKNAVRGDLLATGDSEGDPTFLEPSAIPTGHRILFLDHDDPSRAQVHRDLEAMGHKVASIGTTNEERAGIAFQPDLVIINPDVSIVNRHAFITLLDAEGYSGTLTIVKSSPNFAAVVVLARQFGLDLVDTIDGAYDAQTIARRLETVPQRPHDSEMCDQRFLSWLIQQGRLLPNLTHQFHVKRSLQDNSIAGYETLTRLRNRPSLNPEHIFAPSTILSIEVAATLLAVEAAAKLVSALQADHRVVPVAVNCSVAVLSDHDFIAALPIVLRRHHVAPGMVSIELTEISYPALDHRVLENMRELARIGMPISLDDFGKGATNFDRISDFPVAEVKIDRTLFRKCRTGEFPISLLREIIDYCRNKTIGTVIEGIETDEDLELARLLGADYGQGFYWGRPVPAQTVIASHDA